MANFPKHSQGKKAQVNQVAIEAKTWSGPLPSPENLERFGAIDKSIPLKIVEMAEKEMLNRHSVDQAQVALVNRELDLDREFNKREFWDKQIARIFAAVVIAIIVIPTVWAGVITKDVKAWYFLAGEIVTIASLVIYTQGKAKEKDKK